MNEKSIDLRREKARTAIAQFCKTHSKNTIGIILYGSYAHGTDNEKSDIDFFVLDDSVREPIKIQKEVNGFQLQVTISNFPLLLNKLLQSTHHQHPFFPISLNESLILFEKQDVCTYIKNAAANILRQGPKPAEKQKIELIRTGLINYLNDGTRTKYVGSSKSEKILWAANTIKLCADYLLALNGSWIHYNSTLRNKVLKEKYPDIQTSLHCALDMLLVEFDTSIFAVTIKQIMEEHMSFNYETSGPEHALVI